MTAVGNYMTFQVIDDRGVNLTEQIPISQFEVEWERDRIVEMTDMAPIQEMRSGRIYAAFEENGGIANQFSAVADRNDRITRNRNVGLPVRNGRISLVANLDQGNWVQYQNAHLSSFNYGVRDEAAALIYTAWMFGEAFHLDPTEPCKTNRKIPVQKLDWRKLGF